MNMSILDANTYKSCHNQLSLAITLVLLKVPSAVDVKIKILAFQILLVHSATDD